MRRRLGVTLGAVAVTLLLSARAQALDRELINRAIDRGVSALRALQKPDGTWQFTARETGMTALGALTLLECGAKPDDPAVSKAVGAVRRALPTLTNTYSLALAIILLDHLGEPADAPVIQVLTIRLLSGQTKSGTWSYDCHCLGGTKETQLLTTGLPGKAGNGGEAPKVLSPEVRDVLESYVREMTSKGSPKGPDDHSNTQFATLGLWVGRRYGVPTESALKAIELHYRQCQTAEGGWGYQLTTPTTPPMTAAGILGLAVGDGMTVDVRRKRGETVKLTASKDPAMLAALAYLGGTIGQPVGQKKLGKLSAASDNSFYFLWSLERVCMCLGLDTLARKDWYTWGAEILVVSQDPDDGQWRGLWKEGGADTCFALLFLVRSNLAKDLTSSLRGMFRDPGHVTLRSGGIGGQSLTGGKAVKPAIDTSAKTADLPTKSQPKNNDDATAPADKPATPDAPASRLAEEIVRAPAAQLDEVLNRFQTAKGVVNTEALAAAIPQMPPDGKKKAREALAKRLSRMRTSSLVDYLKDDDAEIRRGAALALAMVESKANVPDLIALLSDPAEAVVLGARAALKALTDKDFGPAAGASAQEKARASAAWRDWWKKQRN